ncbi:enoyl-CoA hydratase/isomerase family protein [Mycobacterium sp. NPDC003449]
MPTRITRSDDGDVTLWLDRAAKRNALDRAMLTDLAAAARGLAGDGRIRTVVLRGAEKYFSAGADIGDWTDPGPHLAAELSRLGTEAFDQIAALPVATVAVIEGGAVGGGLELALACDLRIATSTATLGFPEPRLGNLTAWGGLARLVDTIGLGRTREMFLTGALMSGERAREIGLVHAATADHELDDLLGRTLADLHETEPTAVRAVKSVLAGLETTVAVEPVLAAYFSSSDASRERKQAFLDRRNNSKEIR